MTTAKRPQLLLLISCGWAVRNYLRSGFVRELQSAGDVTALIPAGDEELEGELRAGEVAVKNLVDWSPPSAYNSLRGFEAVAHNRRLGYWNPHLWEWSIGLRPRGKRPYYEFQRAATKLLSRTPFYEALSGASGLALKSLSAGRLYRDIFEEVGPSLVISTNPYSLQELPVSVLAKERGVRSVGIIVSWDNLTYMGPLPAEHNFYAVWSSTMRDDLLRHKPHLGARRVVVTGTPQFDFHKRDDLVWSREEFFSRVGGDPSRPLLTYGGCVDTLFPDEPEFVARLWRATEGGEIKGRPQLLLRLHPHDNKERFEKVQADCPGIIVSRPWPYDGQRYWWFAPGLEHLALLSNTIRYSDVTLNVASSFSLDCAILDKPVVNVAFPGVEGNPKSRHVRNAYYSHHYRRVAESGGVRLAESFEEMLRHVNLYLAEPSTDREARARMVQAICGTTDGAAWKRVADAVVGLLGEAARGGAGRAVSFEPVTSSGELS